VNKVFSQDYRVVVYKVLTKWYQEPVNLSV